MSEKESELLGAIGIKPCRVLSRRLVTIACERHAYLPGLIGGLITFGVVRHNSLPVALATSALAAAALALSLVAHEAGHLLVARRVRGVKPGLLLMRSTGCLSIVEGRYADARGAALFAAGGPLATLAIVVVYLGTWVLLPHGALGTALLVPGFLNLMLLAVNLLPVAPMDGYMLFRSALWASVGNRAEAETRAIRGSVLVLLSAFAVSLVVLCGDGGKGIVALFLVATLTVQHHAASRKLALSRPAS
jgi:Zn-dependent protease